MGRSLQNSLINLGIENKYKEALLDLGYVLEDIYEEVGQTIILFITIGKGCSAWKRRIRQTGCLLP